METVPPFDNRFLAIRSLIPVAGGAFIFLIPAILNGFPFIFQDSADYLIFTPRLYRSPFYGLFIFFFHLNRFIWMPVIAQSLIVSHLVYMMVKVHETADVDLKFFALAIILSLFSSLSFFTSFIMPDIFTSVMFITLYLIGFHFFRFALITRLYLIALACIAVASHLSNLTMAVGMVMVLMVLLRWCGRPAKQLSFQCLILSVPVLLTIAAYLSFNIVVFKSASLSPAGQTFFLANLIEYGPARDYLKAACPQAGYKICAEVERLPLEANDFLWQEGYLDQLGGFAGMAPESGRIVSETIKARPETVAKMAGQNFLAALNQHAPAIELAPSYFPPWSSIYGVIESKFGAAALKAFQNSAEMKNTIPHKSIEAIDTVVVPGSFMLLLALTLISLRKGRRDLVALSVFIIIGVLGNTVLCAMVSGIHDRYQARVTWLLPMADFLVILSFRQIVKIIPQTASP